MRSLFGGVEVRSCLGVLGVRSLINIIIILLLISVKYPLQNKLTGQFQYIHPLANKKLDAFQIL